MSTIKANAYLDASGGNNATINGITPALASQAQAEAGTDNATLMTPLRTSNAITALTTPALVGAAIAGQSVGGIGTLAFALADNSTTYNFGSTIAGSLLLPTSASIIDSGPATLRQAGTGSALTGTWICLGSRFTVSGAAGSAAYYATLWLRIS